MNTSTSSVTSSVRVIQAAPVYGDTYGLGWIGFVHTDGNFVSQAIEYGERTEIVDNLPPVSHALVVTGDGQCTEALMGTGVVNSPLNKYFGDPKVRIYFREPVVMHANMAAQVAEAALSKVGCQYADILIAEEALSKTVIGHLVNEALRDMPHEKLAALLAGKNAFICSMLASYSLAQCPTYAGLDILAEPFAAIDPQRLFGWKGFCDFVNDCSFPSPAGRGTEGEGGHGT